MTSEQLPILDKNSLVIYVVGANRQELAEMRKHFFERIDPQKTIVIIGDADFQENESLTAFNYLLSAAFGYKDEYDRRSLPGKIVSPLPEYPLLVVQVIIPQIEIQQTCRGAILFWFGKDATRNELNMLGRWLLHSQSLGCFLSIGGNRNNRLLDEIARYQIQVSDSYHLLLKNLYSLLKAYKEMQEKKKQGK